jgi:hypothetical protein
MNEGSLVIETVEYGGWPNCIRLSNGEIELVATTDVGPRIIRLGFVGGQNLFKNYPERWAGRATRSGTTTAATGSGTRPKSSPAPTPPTTSPSSTPGTAPRSFSAMRR